MTVKPSKQQARAFAEQGYGSIPLYTELFADLRTPMEVFRILKNVSGHCFILESAEDNQNWGRYTFLGYEPTMEITCADGAVRVRSEAGETVHPAPPAPVLREILRKMRAPRLDGLPPFCGGLMGYFAYDYIKYAEPSLKLDCADAEKFRDLDLMMFDKIVAFDHYAQKMFLIYNAPLSDVDAAYAAAERELGRLSALIRTAPVPPSERGRFRSPLRYLFDRDRYCAMVERAKAYIREGDIFQVVLSNRADADYEGSLLDVYRVLRMTNPSPYMFYMASDDIEITGASPETLVKLRDGVLHTFPLAGTRPRGADAAEDAALQAELLSDEKERAEHNMLVDLGRNDLGKISRFGSVEVTKYMSVEKFSHVMHLGSTVQGAIRDDRDALDAVDAVLPAGTLSGAPKLRACEIIAQLENNKRGIYGGAIGYIDLTGNLDTCIAIRLVFKKNGKVFIRSGAGIVADSVPENEYRECVNKARAVLDALDAAQEVEQ